MNHDPRSTKSKFFGENFVALMDEWFFLLRAIPDWVPPIADPPIGEDVESIDLDAIVDLTGLARTSPGWIDTRAGWEQFWTEFVALHSLLWTVQQIIDVFPVSPVGLPVKREMDDELGEIKRWSPHTHKPVSKFYGSRYLELWDAWNAFRFALNGITLPSMPNIGTLNRPNLLGDIADVNAFMDSEDLLDPLQNHGLDLDAYFAEKRVWALKYRDMLLEYWYLHDQWPSVDAMPSTEPMQNQMDRIKRWRYH